MAVLGEGSSFVPHLAQFLASRLHNAPGVSYSHAVMTDSLLARRKVMEEAFEVCLELGAPEIRRQRVAEESADLLFHLLCGIIGAGVTWPEIEQVLLERHREGTQ